MEDCNLISIYRGGIFFSLGIPRVSAELTFSRVEWRGACFIQYITYTETFCSTWDQKEYERIALLQDNYDILISILPLSLRYLAL